MIKYFISIIECSIELSVTLVYTECVIIRECLISECLVQPSTDIMLSVITHVESVGAHLNNLSMWQPTNKVIKCHWLGIYSLLSLHLN